MGITIKHGLFYGIDTAKLEERMQAVDWTKHPGHWIYSIDSPGDLQLKEMRSVEKELDNYMRAGNDPKASEIWEQLLVKYYADTPLEKAICANVPYLEASFTDYHDVTQHSMNTAINYYELRSQLAQLGYNDPYNLDELKAMVLGDGQLHDIYSKQDGAEFTLSYKFDDPHGYQLYCIDASLDVPGKENSQVFQYLQADVPAKTALELLQLKLSVPDGQDPFMPLDLKETEKYIHLLKANHMNTQNLDFLKKSLLNLGFGEQVNKALEQQIGKKTPEFTLAAKHVFNQTPIDYQLHFKAGESEGMYFFNKYDATIPKAKGEDINQTFYINKGNGITAKEAFNLMEGRAVHKQLFNKEGEKYQAWLQLDPENLTQNGSKEIKRFNENYGFNLEQVLAGKGIKEMGNDDSKQNLLKSLQKGNAQQITVTRGKEEVKYFVTASPQFKTVDLYDHQMKRIKREELLQPSQKTSQSQKQTRQQKEGLPEKKQQSRKRKMTV